MEQALVIQDNEAMLNRSKWQGYMEWQAWNKRH